MTDLEMTKLRTDAERYRWLRSQSAAIQDSVLRPPIPAEYLEKPETRGDLIDAAIDMKMQEKKNVPSDSSSRREAAEPRQGHKDGGAASAGEPG